MKTENPIYWRGWNEEQLAAYQQDQGSSNHCAKYAAASLLNMLFGLVLKGEDLIAWVDSRPLKGTGKYTIFGNGNGSLVFQSAHLVRELGRQVGVPILVKNLAGRKPALLDSIANPDRLTLVTVTYSSENPPVIARGTNAASSLGSVGWIGGHIMIPAAYDPGHFNQQGQSTPWGFLSSWGSGNRIYWMSEKDFSRSWGRFSLYNMVLVQRLGR